MHEVGIAESICDAVRTHVPDGHRLCRVVVEYGPLCGVAPQALGFAFEVVAGHVGLQGAVLEMRVSPAAASCPACSQQWKLEHLDWTCPACGHVPATVDGGEVLKVTEIEVDDV
jgi:hydrogenase nickel incorporation protein HypA/HybF